MRYILLMIAVVMLVGCVENQSAIVESEICNRIGKHTGELTKEDLEKVTALILADTQIADTGLKEVAKLKQLKGLWLHRSKITDAGLKELSKLTELIQLDLGETKITDAGLKELAKMKQLRETKITDAGLKDVAKLQQLTVLSLNNTKVTKAGVAQLQRACRIAKYTATPRRTQSPPSSVLEQAWHPITSQV